MVGALFVTALPLVLAQYSSSLPFLAVPGSGGLDPATASRLLYGLAIIAVLLFLRGGLAGAFRRLPRAAAPPSPAHRRRLTPHPTLHGPWPPGRAEPLQV